MSHKPICPEWLALAHKRLANRKYHFENHDEWLESIALNNEIMAQTVDCRFKKHESRLIVTVATGKQYQDILALTRPLMGAYAQKCNADFVALTRSTQSFPLFEKFRIQPLVAAYDRTIFIDVDCVVRPNARNLFDFVPADMIGIHDDLEDKDHRNWALDQWKLLQDSQNENIPFLERLLNTGVIVLSKQHANIFTPPEFTIPGNHCDEQFWIDRNISVYNHQWFNIPTAFNCQYWFPEFEKLVDTAEIVHLSAAPDRINNVAKYVNQINEKKSSTKDYSKIVKKLGL